MENLEQKAITSVEVADMVGKPHNDLMKDIRRYTSQFNEEYFTLNFTENTYLDKKGRKDLATWSQRKAVSLSLIS